MTINREDIVTAVIGAAGGKLTSRVRLQKAVYLLDRLGLESGFGYEYYHYGPYSRDLDNATGDATAFELLVEDFGRRENDGAMYSIFTVKKQPGVDAVGKLSAAKVRQFMEVFTKTNVTVLEVAATVDWLWHVEKCRDWKSEVQKRKGVKARPERLAKAVELLEGLGLKPPSPAAA